MERFKERECNKFSRDSIMNDSNRIPNRRPILYELFCPICGGSVYAIEEEPAYVGRPETRLSPAGFSITKLECVLCRATFKIDGIGLKYENSIADELGWPFPTEIEDGPNIIPERVQQRMKIRELESDPILQSIEYFYADTYNRSPFPLERDVLHYVLRNKGKFARGFSPIETIKVTNIEDCYNAQVLSVDSRYGLQRKWLPRKISANEYQEGDIIESQDCQPDRSSIRTYFIVYRNQFHPIASTKL